MHGTHSLGKEGGVRVGNNEGVVVRVGAKQEGAVVVVERVGVEPHRTCDCCNHNLHTVIFWL